MAILNLEPHFKAILSLKTRPKHFKTGTAKAMVLLNTTNPLGHFKAHFKCQLNQIHPTLPGILALKPEK